ncbi:MAG: DUF368 domain-containing protein [Clostridia bacterium]|nr:DUF368 domain-containing protein [Clostridia bacterium]
MGEENLQIALVRYNKKTWCKSALLGFFIGLAIIVPGISGSTVAIIFKLYDQFLYAIGNFFKKFKQCFVFLLPIGIGAAVGVLLGFIAVRKLLELLPFAVIFLFAGLMIGAFPAVKDELSGVKMTAKRIALLVIGACIPVGLGAYSSVVTLTGAGANGDILSAAVPLQIALPILVGYLLAITQVVPGLSASAILMAIGWYKTLMNGVENIFTDFSLLIVCGSLVVGFLIGFFTFPKVLNIAFEKARGSAYSLIVGLSLGSVLTMFLGGDIMEVYALWSENGVVVLDLILGIVLLLVGIAVSYWLVRVQRKKSAEAKREE